MTKQEEQIRRIKALVASEETIEHYTMVVDKEFLETEGIDVLKLKARITAKSFNDGAAVIKSFFREEQFVEYEFETDKVYHVAYDVRNDQLFWFDGGVWYMTEDAYNMNELFYGSEKELV